MDGFFGKALRFLSGYLFATIILLFLLLLTYLGTLEQVQSGLYSVQQKYFESVFLVHDFWGVPVPLPGVYLLLVLLFLNLGLGTVLRIRRKWSRAGLYIAHLGIIFLLVGNLVSYRFATHGFISLFEVGNRAGYPSEASEFQSHFEWEIAVWKLPRGTGSDEPGDGSSADGEGTEGEAGNGAETTEYLIPGEDFRRIGRDGNREFTTKDLPFDLVVSRFVTNCRPIPEAGAPAMAIRPFTEASAEGMVLFPLDPEKEAEANLAGCYVEVRPKGPGEPSTGLLWGETGWPWGRKIYPFLVDVGPDRFAIELRKQRYPLPFEIRLKKFNHEMHPGTGMAKLFRSDVQMLEPGAAPREIEISMNEPLRHEGFTLYQSSWGPPNAPPGTPLYSGFSVVENPADKFPLLACIVICVGLLMHFAGVLTRWVQSEMGKER